MRRKLQSLLDRNNSKQALLNAAYILFLLSLLYHFIEQLLTSYDYGSWQISEFLINYQGGFVRRGLTGEILFFFAKHFNINIEWTIKIVCLICFAAVCTFFVRAFLKKGYSLYILPLCFFLGMGVLEVYWIRKDYLFFYVFISVLWLYNKNNLSIGKRLIFINILSVFGILCHEIFAFFALPILFLLLFNQYKNKGVLWSVILATLSLSPSIFAFFLVIIMHGNIETAQSIWDSWCAILGKTPSEVDHWNVAGISAIGWTSRWALGYCFRGNFLTVDKDIISSSVWCITFPVVYYIAVNALLVFRKNENTFTNKHKTVLSSILLFQLLCLSPVFIFLSCDYMRVFFYWIASSFAIFLLMPMDKIKLFPAVFVNFVERINKVMINILPPSKTTLVFLIMFIGICPYWFEIERAYKTTMLYNILFILSKPLIILKSFLLT